MTSLLEADTRLEHLLALGKGLAPVRCAIVHPCDELSLKGALAAAETGLIEPVLVGPEHRIRDCADKAGVLLDGLALENTAHSHAAAQKAAQLAADGRVHALMKGSLHTDEVIRAVLDQAALRTGRRMSHVFRFDVPTYGKPLFITDAALNITPGLLEKADIARNAIALAGMLGIARPKLAILSAVETVNPAIPSTLDAAALCKMAERGQITAAVLDGPLAFDNAISREAARTKGIHSPVAGDADILLVPDLVSGNMLAKQLEYMGGATSSGIVLGARVPLALTSRADGIAARVGSALLAQVIAHRYRDEPP